MESILTTIKKLLGISESDTSFDTDLIFHINTVFSILTQLGVGPSDGYYIEDDSNEWEEYKDHISGDDQLVNLIKTFIHMKVRLIFDPPTSSVTRDNIKQIADELEWRISVTVDPEKDDA